MNQMIPLSAVFWIIIAVSILFLVVYLIGLIVETRRTMEKITNIIDNADAMVTDAKTSVDTVKEGVIEPLSDTLTKLQSVFGRSKKKRRVGLPKRKKKASAK